MKLWRFCKDFVFKMPWKEERKTFYLSYNQEKLEKLEAITFASHHDLYKILRGFKTPFYDQCYFFRKKKGFNSFFFEQEYDVVITNKNNIIIETIIKFKRGSFSQYYNDGFNIFFFVAGSINNLNFKKRGELLIHSKTISLLFDKL